MQARLTLLAFAILLLVNASASAQTPLAIGSDEMTDLVFTVAAGSQAPFHWSHSFSKPTASFMRVHFSSFKAPANQSFTLSIKDRNGRIYPHVYTNGDQLPETFWSYVVEGDYVEVEVVSNAPPTGLGFKIDQIAYQQKHAAKYSLVHNPPELEEVIDYKDEPQIYKPSHAVAKLVFSQNGKTYTCSGFLISDNEFLTNQHCIDRQETCVANAIAIFGYELTPAGMKEGEQFECIELVKSNASLDFALIKLTSHPGQKYGFLTLTRRPAEQGEQTYLIQHPNGEPKQIARKGCHISTLHAESIQTDTDVGHECDTIGGSSGSPLLGKDLKVIGLHHLGFASVGRWKTENRAIQIGKVMDALDLK
jgi:V8-like Glu-specific endopeptidase